MPFTLLRDWFDTLAARRRCERLRWESAARLLESGPQRVAEEPDAAAWRLLGGFAKEPSELDAQTLRDKARHLADQNPYAKNALTLYRNYVIGAGMKQEAVRREAGHAAAMPVREQLAPQRLALVQTLWRQFLDANDWDTGNRKDWEFCLRTWRDGECFLRLFRQPAWPPRIHFVDPEQVAADERTGLPTHGIATEPGNAEAPVAYRIVGEDGHAEAVDAEQMLHTKIGVDGNVKHGVTFFLPVLDALKRFQGWLDVELIQRKVASSIVLVRKHHQHNPGGIGSFADSLATSTSVAGNGAATRRLTLQPGTIIDAQGFDLQFLSPDTHFADASLLGRMMLLSIAAGLGLPEFMLTSDASNANYASTLAAEGPAVRGFASWQSFFSGQWRRLFALVLREAVRLGHLSSDEASQVTLQFTPPPLAVRNRHDEAKADALYFDRGALSKRELARRDQADPDQMERERRSESERMPE